MHKNVYSSANGMPNEKVLTINGLIATCPFQPPFMVPPRIQGQPVQYQRMGCTTTCPFCVYEEWKDNENSEHGKFTLKCTHSEQILDFIIKKSDDNQSLNEAKIHSLADSKTEEKKN